MIYGKRNCYICGKEVIITKRGRINQERVFCSNTCVSKANKKAPNCKCIVCGKEYHRPQSHFTRYNSNYCSYECAYEHKKIKMKGSGNHQYGLKGNKNSSWRSDEKISNYGYKLIRVLDHPFRNSDDMVFEHRLIAEKYLLTEQNSIMIDGKRYLSREYEVHHKDMNRLNNSVDNLVVLTKGQHVSLHNRLTDTKRDEKSGRILTGERSLKTEDEIRMITEEFLRSIT